MKYLVLLLVFVSWKSSYAQQQIRGRVYDENLPLQGVVITNLDTKEIVMSNLDGDFEIQVLVGHLLEIENEGYETIDFQIENLNSIFLQLHPIQSQDLDAVVITALGIGKKQKRLAYDVQEVSTEVMENLTTPSLSNLLTGQVSGLYVSNPTGMQQAPQFTLRGKTPLIVLDGIPVSQEVYEALSQNNIRDIQVLKGTTASALYGSRGRNGAILITSKIPKKKGVEVEFTQQTMVSAGFLQFPKTQTQYGNGSNGRYEFWDGRDGGINDGDMIWGPKLDTGLMLPQWNSPIRNRNTNEIIPWYGSVEGSAYNDRSSFERVPIPWEYHNNLNNFLRTAVIDNTTFSVNSKGEFGSYRLAANLVNTTDRIPSSKLQRGGISLNTTSQVSPKLDIQTSLAYNRSYTPNRPNYDYNPSSHMYTTLIWMGNDVNGTDLKNNLWVPGQEGFRQANWNYAWYNNPWLGTTYFKNIRHVHVVNSQVVLNYKINQDFSLRSRGSLVIDKTQSETQSPKSYFNYTAPRTGQYAQRQSTKQAVDYDVLVTYDKQISPNWTLNINGGGSGYYYDYNYLSAQTDGLLIPNLNNLSNSIGAITGSNNQSRRAIYSVYATAEIGIHDAIYLNLASRNDWSSTLPSNNRSFFYPSTSVSVLLSSLFDFPQQVNLLKMYASWAQVSNDLDPFSLRSYYRSNGTSFNANPMSYYPSLLINPNISPESSLATEVGLQTIAYDNRVQFGLTYYHTKDINQIIRLPISEASGFLNRMENGNEYTTNGLELNANMTWINRKNFRWKTAVNWSKSVQRITAINQSEDRYGNLKIGDRVDAYYAFQWEKAADGNLILNPTTGLPTRHNYLTNLGYLNPDWTFGINQEFKYKNWNLNVGVDGSIGGIMRSEVVEKMWWGGKHPNSTTYRDEEYNSGSFVYVPQGVNVVSGSVDYDVNGNILSDTRVYTPHTTAMSWQTWAQNYPYLARVTQAESAVFANVFDRTFIKLRSVVLGYDFTSMFKESSWVTACSATLSAYNLAMWKKSKNLFSDPDYQVDPNKSSQNDLQDPATRWIGIGVNFKF